MDNFWPACLSRFEQELSTQQFNTWIKPLMLEIENNTIRVLAPNKFVQQWVKERFLSKIESIATEILPANIKIELAILKKTPVNNQTFRNNLNQNNSDKQTAPSTFTLDELRVDNQNQLNNKTASQSNAIINDAVNTSITKSKVITAVSNANSINNASKSIDERSTGRSTGLNPSFNFDNYVTGRANQLARAAAI